MTDGDLLGLHRVVEEAGRKPLPQQATRLDNDPAKLFETEILVDVETLNVDAASFRQMEAASGGDLDGVGRLVLETIAKRGKQHNPVTGSGGMLLGRVARVGARVVDRGFAVGDRIATLASLSLTPLSVSRIRAIRAISAQLDVEGTAVVFASAPLGKLPTDLPERLALAVLDVAGAAPQVARLTGPGETVIVLGGGGKSGLLCCQEARRRVGPEGKVFAFEAHAPFASELRNLGICDEVLVGDAADAPSVRAEALRVTGGRGADLTLSCVNAGGCEMSAILATRSRGRVYFFAMSTSFTAAALGAEGVGADVDLYIGNGFAEGHAEHSLALVRAYPELQALLRSRYA
ncbi:MAG: L-erythro-3,5-diaminohexanoate dehydrogenase [Polyangiaceae bacterium]